MNNRGKKINDIMKFVKGEKVEKHHLRYLDENDNPIPELPDKETINPFDIVVRFVDFSKGKNKDMRVPVYTQTMN
jgi:hypothetical protein